MGSKDDGEYWKGRGEGLGEDREGRIQRKESITGDEMKKVGGGE